MSSYYNDVEHFPCEVLQKNIRLGNLPEGYVDERDVRQVHAIDFVGYQHVHLFAGIGAFALGMFRAGYPESIRTLTGGFPCTDISNAGKRTGLEGEQSGLWFEMYRLIQEATISQMGFDIIIVENVAALIGRGLSRVLGDLAEAGYDAEWIVLRGADFGAPHERERIFIVAYASSTRQQECNVTSISNKTGYFTGCLVAPRNIRQPQSFMGGVINGISGWLDRYHWPARSGKQQYHWEPTRTTTDKPKDSVARLKALGNAIIPQCVEYVARCILEHYNMVSR